MGEFDALCHVPLPVQSMQRYMDDLNRLKTQQNMERESVAERDMNMLVVQPTSFIITSVSYHLFTNINTIHHF